MRRGQGDRRRDRPHVEDKKRRYSGEGDTTNRLDLDATDAGEIIGAGRNGSVVFAFASEANGVFQHSLSVAADSVIM
jgi:hypothetical protein